MQTVLPEYHQTIKVGIVRLYSQPVRHFSRFLERGKYCSRAQASRLAV